MSQTVKVGKAILHSRRRSTKNNEPQRGREQKVQINKGFYL